MAMDSKIKIIQGNNKRVKIFVDYWNVVISARSQTDFDVSVRWKRLIDYIVRQVNPRDYHDETMPTLAGCYIFGSYSRSDSNDLRHIEEVQDKYGQLDGLFFDFQERISKKTTQKCKNCKEPLQTSSEAGVDIKLAVEMIKHAVIKEHDYLAIVSSDRDFIPVLQFLKDLGERVVHFAPDAAHREMRQLTWKQVFLNRYLPNFSRLVHGDYLILYGPHQSGKADEAAELLSKSGKQFRRIDISNRDEIKDRDLEYLLKSCEINFRWKGEDNKIYFRSWELVFERIYDFRKALFDNQLAEGLPCVIKDGSLAAQSDDTWNWTISTAEDEEMWKSVKVYMKKGSIA